MEVERVSTRPPHAPIETYETRFIYIGHSRYDTEKKRLSRFERNAQGHMVYTETPSPSFVFSRGYHTEHVRVLVYSHSPRVWTEELSPTESETFRELRYVSTS